MGILSADFESNVFGRKEHCVRVVFGTASVASYRAYGVTITRTGAGTYDFDFDKPWDQLIDFHASMTKRATGVVPLLGKVTDKSLLGTTTKRITAVLEDTNSAGTATDPANGDEATFTFVLSDDRMNAQYGG